jgi:hypothetical protein
MSPVILVEKIGRFTWIGFIVLSGPCAIFCAGTTMIGLPLLFVEEIGPIETIPTTTTETCVAWTSLLAHPILWICSVFYAHRFNAGLRAALPFVLNLLPIVGLLWFVNAVSFTKSQQSIWSLQYLWTIAAALVAGLGAVILSSFLSKPIRPQPCAEKHDHQSPG